MKREAIPQWLGNVPMSESDGFSRERGDIDRVPLELKYACFEFGDLEESGQQKLHVLARLLDQLEELVVFLLGKLLCSSQQGQGISFDDRERRAKLMTNRG